VFAYKGQHPTPGKVGRELNVRYVVEGSIRRVPERIRVSGSLTDTNRSALLWSEKYEAEPKDIFAVQDRITRRITGALALQVTNLELARSATKPPNNLEAYDLVLRGRDLLSRLTRYGVLYPLLVHVWDYLSSYGHYIDLTERVGVSGGRRVGGFSRYGLHPGRQRR
jgi:hypothetical protein